MTDELSSGVPILLTVEARAHGWRIDHYLSRIYPNFSRALFQKSIEQGAVLVNGVPVKTSRRLRVNDRLSIRLPDPPDRTVPPEEIPLEIVFEDESLVVLNKRAGLIVHPGRGNPRGTLAGALQFHFDNLSDMAGKFRPGIVHRLDRDTSGILVIAKDNQVHHRLSGQFERREVTKEYFAITFGEFDLDRDVIETYIRVNPHKREKMVVSQPDDHARVATTSYEVAERFRGFTSVRLFPKTGRTHQLRVHLQHVGHPILADRVYGGGGDFHRCDILARVGQRTLPRAVEISTTEKLDSAEEKQDLLINRQALHALRLAFVHPRTGRQLEFEAPLPADIARTLEALRELAARS